MILKMFFICIAVAALCIKIKHLSAYSTTSMSLDEMIKTIFKAGYEVRKNEHLEGG